MLLPGLPLADDPMAHGAEGHRRRMRERLLTAGPDSLADHEMLEMVLFLALPRRDTKQIARELLARFRSLGGVIGAPVPDLRMVDGLGSAGVAALKLMQATALRMLRHEVASAPVLTHWDRLLNYLRAGLQHEKVEQFRVLYLDNRNRLLADEVQSRGTVNHAPAYPREVLKRALELHATAIILTHNHPSGDPTASREDVAMTREIQRAMEPVRIMLHDHVIIAGNGWLSFRQQGLL
ncbi:MAG TPA: DNA repair protein RadC [Acetobacteraceae bacterium]